MKIKLVLVALVAFLAFASNAMAAGPAEGTNGNNIVCGGVPTKSELIRLASGGLDSCGHKVAPVWTYYGITPQVAKAMTKGTVCTADGNWISSGRLPSPVPALDKKVTLAGTTFNVRPLLAFGPGCYDAWKGVREDGTQVAVLMGCGNPETTRLPSAHKTPPKDLCTNIKGVQTDTTGYIVKGTICTKPKKTPPKDLCTNIKGVQTDTTGYIVKGTICTKPEVKKPPADKKTPPTTVTATCDTTKGGTQTFTVGDGSVVVLNCNNNTNTATGGDANACTDGSCNSGPAPTRTCTDRNASNYGDPLPCTYPPAPTPTTTYSASTTLTVSATVNCPSGSTTATATANGTASSGLVTSSTSQADADQKANKAATDAATANAQASAWAKCVTAPPAQFTTYCTVTATYSPNSLNVAVNATGYASNGASPASISYNWGEAANNSSTHTYTTYGQKTITVTVTWNGGPPAVCQQSVTLTAPNQPPVVSWVNLPQHVYSGGVAQVCATATDPEGDNLSVVISASLGHTSTTYQTGGNVWCIDYVAPTNNSTTPGNSFPDTLTVTANDFKSHTPPPTPLTGSFPVVTLAGVGP